MASFDSPFIVFAAVLAVQCLAAYAGDAAQEDATYGVHCNSRVVSLYM
jgi:hypothetical protein